MPRLRYLCALVCSLSILPAGIPATAQPQGKSSSTAAQSSSSAQPSTTNLVGLSYARDNWVSALSAEPIGQNIRILCFALMPTRSASAPFIFQSTASIVRSSGGKVNCSPVDAKHPLMMDSILVVALDGRQADLEAIKLLNINVTTAAGTPISPNPIRPSFGASTSSNNLGEAIYFLTWPVQLAGDTIPTINVNAIYTPPTQGQPWQAQRLYPPGSIVVPNKTPDGHYYETPDGGVSGSEEPSKWNQGSAISDANCSWVPVPSGGSGTIKGWIASNAQLPFDVIFVPLTGQYYSQTNPAGCKTGSAAPKFVVARSVPTTEKAAVSSGTVEDGTVIWKDQGSPDPNCGNAGGTAVWKPGTYAMGAKVCNPAQANAVFMVTTAGTSSSQPPAFLPGGIPIFATRPAVWFDIGQTLPSSVTSTPPQDESIALNLTLPQTHSVSFYNLASGVFVSSIHTPTYAFTAGATPGPAVQTSNPVLIDPVISFTRYIKGFDAERPWRAADLIPAVGLSFSLSAPTSNFYFGGSSEVLRYVQLDYGLAIAKVSELAPQAYNSSTATSPATTQSFKEGAYIGLSFNISGLIQGVASAATGGSGSSSGSGGSGKGSGSGSGTSTP